jgi:dihydropteroate synthase
MGVVNVTPDSFSDGGRWADTDSAVRRGLELVADGADIVDVGGESTRPGAHRVDADTEAARVVPVIRRLVEHGVLCSVDTTRAVVAGAAIEAGAAIVNDVSGGLADPGMVAVVADAQVPWILMHWRGPSEVMQSLAQYDDVVQDVRRELLARIDAALRAGVDERCLIVDPGLGFAKLAQHNWDLVVEIGALVELGLPVLIGASRKRFLGELLAEADGSLRPPAGREVATAAVSMLAAQRGVWGVRVHEPRPSIDAMAVADATRFSSRVIVDDWWYARAVPDGPLVTGSRPPSGPEYHLGALRRPPESPATPEQTQRLPVRRVVAARRAPRLPVRRIVRHPGRGTVGPGASKPEGIAPEGIAPEAIEAEAIEAEAIELPANDPETTEPGPTPGDPVAED